MKGPKKTGEDGTKAKGNRKKMLPKKNKSKYRQHVARDQVKVRQKRKRN